jgi:O-antigen/teichoic acid export membrane protein
VAALVNSGIKLVGGYWLLRQGAGVAQLAWLLPLGSALSLLIFVPALLRLLRRVPQRLPAALSLAFSIEQMRLAPAFFVIHLFSVFDYQTDNFLISLLLSEVDLGWYGAAQTILLGFLLLPAAMRTAIYPLMARYHRQSPEKLAFLHQKVTQYSLAIVLPLATGVCLLAGPLVRLLFGDGFAPAVPALQWSIWTLIFMFLNVPGSRLMVIHNRQREVSLITGLSMVANILLNLWLIPRLGIVGAAVSRLLASSLFFLGVYLYVQMKLLPGRLWVWVPRPLIATLAMAAAVWPLRTLPLPLPVLAGVLVYLAVSYWLGVFPRQDLIYWQQLYQTR